MDNYKIITDEQKLRGFIDWLPDIENTETYYLCLFARSKYCKGITHIRSDKAQIKRFTSNKELMFDKIKQLECELGSYKQRGLEIPQEALALYITINPRDLVKANINSAKKLFDLALQPYNGFNPHQEVMSEIQKSKSRSEFVTFDFDCSAGDFALARIEFENILPTISYNIIKTRGGYHLIVNPKIATQCNKHWYNPIKDILNKYSTDTDNAGDIMCPVVGTYQGGFTPTFI